MTMNEGSKNDRGLFYELQDSSIVYMYLKNGVKR